MSRHRNIRNMKDDDLSDEDDDAFSPSSYDGWSGSPSSASPGMAQYFYDRTRTTDITSFVPGTNNKPSPLRTGFAAQDDEETVLRSLVSQVLDVVGDQFDEEDAQKALKLHNNNIDKAVNYLLEQSTSGNKDDLFEMEMEQPKANQSKEPMLSFILGITGAEGSKPTSSTQRQVSFSPSVPTTSPSTPEPSSTPSALSVSPPENAKPASSAPVKTTTPSLGRGFRAPHSNASAARGGSFARPLHSKASTQPAAPKPQPNQTLTLEDATKIKSTASPAPLPASQPATSTPQEIIIPAKATSTSTENAFTIPLKSPTKSVTKSPSKTIQQKDEEDKFNSFQNVGQVPSPLAQTLCDETPAPDLSSLQSMLFHDNTTDNATSYIKDLYSLLYASIERAVNFAEGSKEAVTPFKFDTPSPDDVVFTARKQAVKQKKTGEAPKASPAPAPSVSRLDDELSSMNLGEFSEPKQQPAFRKEALSTPVSVKDEVAELKSIDKKQAKQMSAARRKEIEDLMKNRSHEKPHINMVVVGHVDAGKSTLMGHLLYDLGNVSQKVMHKYEKESKNIGKASFSYAWVLDEHEEERNRGITMDIGVTNFETNSRKITLLDAPGHRDFVPNMITGASQADVALLVIDATTDGFEKGFDSDGQTKEHALLVRSLGVSQLGVAINKLDTVDWSKERYDFIVSKLGTFLKQSGFAGQSVWFVPCSGLTGENLIKCTEQKLKSWYQGPTLVEKIDNFVLPQRENDKPFRLCVSDIYKAQALGVTIGGKIESGMVSVGDKLLLMPLNEICVVKGIRVHGETAEYASAGENVDIGLSGLEITSLSVGDFLCAPESPIPMTTRFRAKIITFSLQKPILKGQISELHYLNVNEPCNISVLMSVLDRSSGEVKKKNPRSLGDNTSALVEITTPKPVCIELKTNFNQIGRFTLRENGRSIAAGIVTEIL